MMQTVKGSVPDQSEVGGVNDHVMADLEDFLKPGRMAREWYHPRMKKWLLFEEPLAEEMVAAQAEFGGDMLFCFQHAKEYSEMLEAFRGGAKLCEDHIKFMKKYQHSSKTYVPKLIATLSSSPKLTVEAATNLLASITPREGDELLSEIGPLQILVMKIDDIAKLKNSSASSAESSIPTTG